MNLLQKKKPKFMTKEDLKELRNNVEAREEELELRKKQLFVESGYKKSFNFDPEKLKKSAIIIVSGLAITFIIIKIISKFI